MHYATEANQNPICVRKVTLGRFLFKFCQIPIKNDVIYMNYDAFVYTAVHQLLCLIRVPLIGNYSHYHYVIHVELISFKLYRCY